jgi:hypothetical protein
MWVMEPSLQVSRREIPMSLPSEAVSARLIGQDTLPFGITKEKGQASRHRLLP